MLSPGSGGGKDRRFSGLKDLFNHLNAVGSRGLAAIGSKSRARLQEDEKTVTLQVGKSVFDGAPRNMRTELWMSSLQRKGIGVAASQKYEDMLLSPVGAEAAADIDKDLGRTFPSMRRFATAEGQDTLRRVLRAYAALDPEVGYCQGMNFVAGLLLMYVPERHAFGGLVVLMQDRGLRKYYSTDMSLIQTHLWQLGRLMPTRLCTHLESIGVLPLLYGASWLMTCFSADFPASFSARVMDVIMADKMDQALLKAAVALLKRCECKLLQMTDMEDALHLLKLELPAWEEPLLHDVLTDAFSKPWSSRQTQLLGSLEGAETVAEALTRVQRANLAASMDSIPSLDSGADDAPSPSSGSAAGAVAAAAGASIHGGSRSVTPSLSAHPSGGGASSGGAAGGSSGGTAVMPLFPPPPSPKRPSSTGPASAGMSPASSRAVSRATSQTGAAWHAAVEPHLAPAPPATAVGQTASCDNQLAAQPLPALQQLGVQGQAVQLDMIDMSSPRASLTAAGSLGLHIPLDHHNQQQQQYEGEDSNSWDPFGMAGASAQQRQSAMNSSYWHQQEQDSLVLQQLSQLPPPPQQLQHGQLPVASSAAETVRQQLQELSFTQLSSPESGQQGQPPSAPADDDWGDFLSPHS